MDTFVPNDVFLVGGAGNDSYPDVHGVDDFMPEGSTLGNSVLMCTGANACGKVRIVHISPARKVPECYDAERLPQTGAFIVPEIFLGPRLRIWRLKDRTDTTNGTSRFIDSLFYPPSAEGDAPRLAGKLLWLPLPGVIHFASFVPAESATLGIVDKGAWCWDLTAVAPSFFFILMSSFHPRSNSGVGLKSNSNDLLLQTWSFVDSVVLQSATLCLRCNRRL